MKIHPKKFLIETSKSWLFSLLLPISLFSQSPYLFRVDFTDKNNSSFSISNPAQFLSQRAIDRRNRQNIPVIENDLPLQQNYIDSILNSGNVNLLNRSKWLNSITISTDDSSIINQINSYSFVKYTKQWRRTESHLSEEKLNPRLSMISRGNDFSKSGQKISGFDYGTSFNQADMINIDFLHDLGFTGSGMLIAVLDAGFIAADSMQAFDHLYQTNRIIATKNFVDGTDSVYKSATHGTFVLSTMAALLPSQLIGTAPDAGYILIISEDIASETVIEEFNWVAAAEYADSAGADIINSSLGYTTFDNNIQDHIYSEMDGNTAIATIGADMAASKGILVVNSAGNSGAGSWNFIAVPADADSILSIGAVDANRNYASFSSNGPTADGRVKPNVSAQGQGTVLAYTDGSIIQGSGTSFSSPIMAGAAACLWQTTPNASNMQIIDLIHRCASQYNNPDTLLGYGIPDFELAYEILTNKIFVDEDSFSIYPNPFSNDVFIDFYSPDKKLLSAVLYDIRGRKILSLEKNLVEGLNRISFEKCIFSGNSPYILELRSGDTVIKKLLVKI